MRHRSHQQLPRWESRIRKRNVEKNYDNKWNSGHHDHRQVGHGDHSALFDVFFVDLNDYAGGGEQHSEVEHSKLLGGRVLISIDRSSSSRQNDWRFVFLFSFFQCRIFFQFFRSHARHVEDFLVGFESQVLPDFDQEIGVKNSALCFFVSRHDSVVEVFSFKLRVFHRPLRNFQSLHKLYRFFDLVDFLSPPNLPIIFIVFAFLFFA